MKKVLSFIAMLFFGYFGFIFFGLFYNMRHNEDISDTKIAILGFVVVVCMFLARFFWKKFREPNEIN
jgi:drug/metabolite transporter (DMT)-like permease